MLQLKVKCFLILVQASSVTLWWRGPLVTWWLGDACGETLFSGERLRKHWGFMSGRVWPSRPVELLHIVRVWEYKGGKHYTTIEKISLQKILPFFSTSWPLLLLPFWTQSKVVSQTTPLCLSPQALDLGDCTPDLVSEWFHYTHTKCVRDCRHV